MMIETEADLSAAIAEASGPLRLRGGGTRDLGREGVGDVVSTAGLCGVTLYEPGALTLVAQAGTPVAEIEATLEAEGQRLAFEPYFLGGRDGSTIGGVVATNASGPRRIQAGAARDFLLGVRFVDGRGTVIKNGGRVMKNVTGYDLVKVMAGSWGTLGVLTEVSLKVMPRPETEATLALEDLSAEAAVAAMSGALSSPFDVSGAACVGGRTLIRVEGFEASVAYRVAQLQSKLAAFGSSEVVAQDWSLVRDARALRDGAGDIWRISVTPLDGPGVIARLPERSETQMDWGGGLVWARVPSGTDVRAAIHGVSGHATVMRAAAETHARLGSFQPEAPGVAALSAGLRARFDPRGILNPGLMAVAA